MLPPSGSLPKEYRYPKPLNPFLFRAEFPILLLSTANDATKLLRFFPKCCLKSNWQGLAASFARYKVWAKREPTNCACPQLIRAKSTPALPNYAAKLTSEVASEPFLDFNLFSVSSVTSS